MGHRCLQIISQRIPTGQDWSPLHPRFKQPQRRSLCDLERTDDAVAKSLAPERVGVGRQQRADPAEVGNQLLRQWLGISPRDGEREEIFNQLMVEQRLPAPVEQALAEAGAVPG